ncbi:purine permease 3 [Cocos nucifera]|uniref:Probable purine permease n=1 Tax=Cocos nucifera TaxID=13894 RepID=A0A8K0I8W2_COCNU|nr:purine permease 3 [Cocos nucifera]
MMDAEGQQNHHPKDPQMSKRLKMALVVLNCLLLFVGDTGGPLVSRLYFRHGGHRQWLASWLETGGWPLILLPLSISYLYRRRLASDHHHPTKLFFLTPRLFLACVVLGLLTGTDDFLYAYGLSFLPVSTSAILISTQLAFTASFAFLIVKQKFTPYSINSIALLTVGAVMLGLHTSSDRPDNVSQGQYLTGFFLTLGTAALYGLILPLVELTYRKARQVITYTLVMEMQLVMGFFATAFCTIGMLVNKDFEAIPREARQYGLGEVKYYMVLVWAAILWQCFFLGTVGVIFCVNTLLAGIIIAVLIPVIELFAAIFLHEKFTSEKGVSLGLCLWGLASYSYGEYRENKEKKEAALKDQTTGLTTGG